MTARLVNFNRTLAWTDFRGRVPRGAGHDAFTSTRYQVGGLTWSGRAGHWAVADTIVVTVVLREHNSWVKDGRQSAPLLAHEQLHYDITALLARDLCNALTPLPTRTFATGADAEREAGTLVAGFNAQSIHDRYDTHTAHGDNAGVQAMWASCLRGCMAPTAGTPVPLLEALRRAGLG